MAIRLRLRDDALPVRVRAYASQRDAYVRVYVRVYVPFRPRRVDVDDSGRRANARANAFLLRAYVYVRVLSFSVAPFAER